MEEAHVEKLAEMKSSMSISGEIAGSASVYRLEFGEGKENESSDYPFANKEAGVAAEATTSGAVDSLGSSYTRSTMYHGSCRGDATVVPLELAEGRSASIRIAQESETSPQHQASQLARGLTSSPTTTTGAAMQLDNGARDSTGALEGATAVGRGVVNLSWQPAMENAALPVMTSLPEHALNVSDHRYAGAAAIDVATPDQMEDSAEAPSAQRSLSGLPKVGVAPLGLDCVTVEDEEEKGNRPCAAPELPLPRISVSCLASTAEAPVLSPHDAEDEGDGSHGCGRGDSSGSPAVISFSAAAPQAFTPSSSAKMPSSRFDPVVDLPAGAGEEEEERVTEGGSSISNMSPHLSFPRAFLTKERLAARAAQIQARQAAGAATASLTISIGANRATRETEPNRSSNNSPGLSRTIALAPPPPVPAVTTASTIKSRSTATGDDGFGTWVKPVVPVIARTTCPAVAPPFPPEQAAAPAPALLPLSRQRCLELNAALPRLLAAASKKGPTEGFAKEVEGGVQDIPSLEQSLDTKCFSTFWGRFAADIAPSPSFSPSPSPALAAVGATASSPPSTSRSLDHLPSPCCLLCILEALSSNAGNQPPHGDGEEEAAGPAEKHCTAEAESQQRLGASFLSSSVTASTPFGVQYLVPWREYNSPPCHQHHRQHMDLRRRDKCGDSAEATEMRAWCRHLLGVADSAASSSVSTWAKADLLLMWQLEEEQLRHRQLKNVVRLKDVLSNPTGQH